MFYEDLSEYDYQDEDAFTDRESGVYALWYRPAYTRLNIGWLEVSKPYSTGTAPTVFVEKLKAVEEVQRLNVCLGCTRATCVLRMRFWRGTGWYGFRADPALLMPLRS
ncbi:hypothetical protein [Streptomyces sp. ISL-66]|uniref:DUF7919 family protein n=1 Tax=Streptomyces sp. ISL-66 TaxID=2819186 RepID=UPI00203653FE|nr:hypothetical protein [Streptomyces sp. ISL-66]